MNKPKTDILFLSDPKKIPSPNPELPAIQNRKNELGHPHPQLTLKACPYGLQVYVYCIYAFIHRVQSSFITKLKHAFIEVS